MTATKSSFTQKIKSKPVKEFVITAYLDGYRIGRSVIKARGQTAALIKARCTLLKDIKLVVGGEVITEEKGWFV